MKLSATTLAILSFTAPADAEQRPVPERVAPPIVHSITPALGVYTDAVLFGDVWKRTELAPRDRSMVTVAALVAGGHTGQTTGHFNRALDNGVKPSEIAAIITHLAFYSGWPRAMSAVGVAREVFEKRGIVPNQLESGPQEPLAVAEAAEARRAAAVEAQAGDITPALVRYTSTVLFGDLWRRADLAPRDRSLVTIVALIAAGQVDQLPFHMNRGMDNGLDRIQLSEVITHLAFYAGCPRVMSAIPVAKSVFEARVRSHGGIPDADTQRKKTMDILRKDSQLSSIGSTDYFTGSVRIDSRFQQEAPARIAGAFVTFEPGARTAWHTHPLGQTLIVTSGCGWVQREGEEIQEILPGDVVWIPPGEKHWHGATATLAMTHMAIVEALDGKSTDWMEKVSDEQYRQGSRARKGC